MRVKFYVFSREGYGSGALVGFYDQADAALCPGLDALVVVEVHEPGGVAVLGLGAGHILKPIGQIRRIKHRAKGSG